MITRIEAIPITFLVLAALVLVVGYLQEGESVASPNTNEPKTQTNTPPLFNERLQTCKTVNIQAPTNKYINRLTTITVLDTGSMATVFDHTDKIYGYIPISSDEIQVCDIIVYQTADMNHSIIHRVNHIFEDGSYLMSGDTANRYDSRKPTFEDVINRVVEVRRR